MKHQEFDKERVRELCEEFWRSYEGKKVIKENTDRLLREGRNPLTESTDEVRVEIF